MYCKKCGSRVSKGSDFCELCGAKVDNDQHTSYDSDGSYTNYDNNGQNTGYANVDPAAKSKLAAGLLQILIPGLAIGRFYLGYTSIAITQIAVSILTCGIGTLWPIIDGILILTGSVPTDADGRPLRD